VTALFIACAILAGLLHVLIWVMESLVFTRPAVYRRFGVRTQADALVLQAMALNQGFYNLFLAAGAIGGAVATLVSDTPAARAVAMFACASMVAAAVVLLVSNPKLARAAAIQGVLPAIAVVAGLF
jgi:putative membrane protein